MHIRNPFRLPVPLLLFIICAACTGLISCSNRTAVEKHLHALNLEYSIDSEGDYRVRMILDTDREVQVGIKALAEQMGVNAEVREIWSVAARIPDALPDGLAEDLLEDSWSSRGFGAWALAGSTSLGRQVLVYIVRIPEPSTTSILLAALQDAAESAQGLHDALKTLEGE